MSLMRSAQDRKTIYPCDSTRKRAQDPKQTDLIESELTNIIAIVTWKHQSRFLLHFELSRSAWDHIQFLSSVNF